MVPLPKTEQNQEFSYKITKNSYDFQLSETSVTPFCRVNHINLAPGNTKLGKTQNNLGFGLRLLQYCSVLSKVTILKLRFLLLPVLVQLSNREKRVFRVPKRFSSFYFNMKFPLFKLNHLISKNDSLTDR